jgi:hypothetical protein
MSGQKRTSRNRRQGHDIIEMRSDGWDRFRRAVNAAAQSGPKHRADNKSKKVRAKKAR